MSVIITILQLRTLRPRKVKEPLSGRPEPDYLLWPRSRWCFLGGHPATVKFFSGKESYQASLDLPTSHIQCHPVGTEPSLPTNPCASQAANKQAMLYWLQQLQMKRWEFHNSLPAPPVVPDAALAGNEPALRLELGTQRVHLLCTPRALGNKASPLLLGVSGRSPLLKKQRARDVTQGRLGHPYSDRGKNMGSQARLPGSHPNPVWS